MTDYGKPFFWGFFSFFIDLLSVHTYLLLHYFSLAGVLFFKLAFWKCFANTRYAFILFFLINVQGYELSL